MLSVILSLSRTVLTYAIKSLRLLTKENRVFGARLACVRCDETAAVQGRKLAPSFAWMGLVENCRTRPVGGTATRSPLRHSVRDNEHRLFRFYAGINELSTITLVAQPLAQQEKPLYKQVRQTKRLAAPPTRRNNSSNNNDGHEHNDARDNYIKRTAIPSYQQH